MEAVKRMKWFIQRKDSLKLKAYWHLFQVQDGHLCRHETWKIHCTSPITIFIPTIQYYDTVPSYRAESCDTQVQEYHCGA